MPHPQGGFFIQIIIEKTEHTPPTTERFINFISTKYTFNLHILEQASPSHRLAMK